MSVTIKKLTPPQVTAVRNAFPVSVSLGWITTTASQVTFVDIAGKEPWRVANLVKLFDHAAKELDSQLLDNVLAKLETRPDLVKEA